ncbi:MAG TPA: ATP-binding protein, partial [Candidatus Binatia bacterium]|nr:ATP-binding protein [Candidatus Binatia bacterium]
MLKGMVVSGGFGDLLVREKSSETLELGELLVAETPQGMLLLHVFDLVYGSQLSQQHLELVSGLKLEEDEQLNILDPELRTYVLAKAKGLVLINGSSAVACKSLPRMFSSVRQIEAKDVTFLTKPATPLFVGNLRSGSKVLPVPIQLSGADVLSHHVLVSATTGKGKSNLAYCMLWDLCGKDYAGVLVLDPHDEYYGRNRVGLKDHAAKDKVVYYSPDPVPGGRTLKINLALVQPHHFDGVAPWSDAQRECVMAYWKRYQQQWIEMVFLGELLPGFQDGTVAVVRRRLQQILDVKQAGDALETTGVFDKHAGSTTVADIVKDLESGKIVIIDTSSFAGQVELLI